MVGSVMAIDQRGNRRRRKSQCLALMRRKTLENSLAKTVRSLVNSFPTICVWVSAGGKPSVAEARIEMGV